MRDMSSYGGCPHGGDRDGDMMRKYNAYIWDPE